MNKYFDQTATELPSEEVLQYYFELLKNASFNPAARYSAALEGRRLIQSARERIAELLVCLPEEVVFTSSASESINHAIKGYAFAPGKKSKIVLTSELEHEASHEALAFLQRQGWTVHYCPSKNGLIDLQAFSDHLEKEELDFASVIWVNNESGAITPIRELSDLRKRIRPSCLIHTDAVQAAGKIPINFKNSGADLLSISCHKFGSPKGIAYLLIKNGVRLEPLIHGGGQQNNRRSGTENTALVLASVFALEKAVERLNCEHQKLIGLKQLLLSELGALDVKYCLNSPEPSVPGIISIQFPALRGETLLNALSEEGYAISLGSACSSQKKEQSKILKALGLGPEEARHSVRISLSADHSSEDIRSLCGEIARILKQYGVTKNV